MAKAGNAKSGFGAGSAKMGGPGKKPMPPKALPKMGTSKPVLPPKPMPPGVGVPSGSGPGATGPMGAFKKGGPVKRGGK